MRAIENAVRGKVNVTIVLQIITQSRCPAGRKIQRQFALSFRYERYNLRRLAACEWQPGDAQFSVCAFDSCADLASCSFNNCREP